MTPPTSTQLDAPTADGATGPVVEPAGARWVAVCPLDRLLPERGVAALVDGEPVAVFLLEDGSIHAVGHRDPFSGANVMARGIVGSMGSNEDYRDTVASPMYKQVFDLRTGECLSEPGPALPVHPVRVIDGLVHASGSRDTAPAAGAAAGP